MLAVLAFSVFSVLVLYLLQRVQGWLPFNPMGFGTSHAMNGATPMTPDLALQHRRQLPHQHQLAELRRRIHDELPRRRCSASTVQNFLSAADRHRRRHRAGPRLRARTRRRPRQLLGRPVTRARSTCCCRSVVSARSSCVWQGVTQNLQPYVTATTLEGASKSSRKGPVASQEAIKMLGTNGGGFFNANSAHPFENPTPLTNFVADAARSSCIPAALTYTFGRMVGDTRQGWALFAAMAVMFVPASVVCYWSEAARQPDLARRRADRGYGAQPAATWRARRCASASPIRAVRHRHHRRRCGAVNTMHDSFTPLGGAGPDGQHA